MQTQDDNSMHELPSSDSEEFEISASSSVSEELGVSIHSSNFESELTDDEDFQGSDSGTELSNNSESNEESSF
jgi:hypothetical protein